MTKLMVFAAAIIFTFPCSARESVYVGEGRYSCSGDSVDCATLRQRNNDFSRRQRERMEDERRYEREERREREYERNYDYDFDRYNSY